MPEALDDALGVQLPAKHCSFKGCKWAGVTDDDLQRHLEEMHASFFEAGVQLLQGLYTYEEKIWGLYSAA